MSHPSSPSSSSITPPPSSPLHAAGTAFLIPSPLRAKKSRVEVALPPTGPPPPPLKPSSARALSTSADVAHLKHSKVATAAEPGNHDELDAIDQQLCLATQSMSINFMERDIVSLFQDLSSAPSSSACRLPLVRSIKNKLIGSELNKRLVLSQHLELILVHLLRDLVEEDDSTHDALRLELMTALASLAAHHLEGADRLLQNDFLPLVLHSVRGGLRGLQEAGVRALRHLVSSCSAQERTQVVRRVFQHVDVVTVLVGAVRQWQGPLSELAVDVLSQLCTTQEHRLCLIQHGLLAALFGHISAKRPLSSGAFAVPVPFLASLRLLAALVEDNGYLVLFLSTAPALPSSPFAALSMTASSLFSFCSSLLLHADPLVKLYASSILLFSALVHLSLTRRSQRHTPTALVTEDEERWRHSDLLRLHSDFHASPIGKRGRGGSDKATRKAKDGDRAAPFPLYQWMAALRPAAIAAASAPTLPTSPSLQLLSCLLPRVLHVLTRLLDSSQTDLPAAVYPLLTRAVDGHDACQEEVGQVLPTLLQHLLQLTIASSPTPSPPSPPAPLVPVLRLLCALSSHETNRRVILSIAAYSACLLWCLSTPPDPRSPVLSLTLCTLARLAASHRFHLCAGLASSPIVPPALLSKVTDADPAVATAALTALTALLAPHTSVRGDVLRLFHSPITDTVFALARGTTQLTHPQGREDELDAVGFDASPRVAALALLAGWSQRASGVVQAAVVRGMGGWKGVVSMVEEKVDDPALLCTTLRLVQQLVAPPTSPSEARDLDNWSRPGVGEGEDRAMVAEEGGATSGGLTRADLTLLLQALVARMSTQGSGGLGGGEGVEEEVLGVLSTVATHPACTSSMLLSSTPVLAFLLQCLRSARTATRETAVGALHHALLTLAEEEEETLASGRVEEAVEEAKSRPLTRRERQREEKRGKRRRSAGRWDDSHTGDRRKRRSATSDAGVPVAAVDVEESSEEEKASPDVVRLSAHLQRLSSAGLITQLSHMRRHDDDQAVVERVKRTLLLIQLLDTVVTPGGAAPWSAGCPGLDDLRRQEMDSPLSPSMFFPPADDARLDAVFGQRGQGVNPLQQIMARMHDLGWGESAPFAALDSELEERKGDSDEEEEDAGDEEEDVEENAGLAWESSPSVGGLRHGDGEGGGGREGLESLLSPMPPTRWRPSYGGYPSERSSVSSRFDSLMHHLHQVRTRQSALSHSARQATPSSTLQAMRGTMASGSGDAMASSSSSSSLSSSSATSAGREASQSLERMQLVLDRRGRQMRAIADALGVPHEQLRSQILRRVEETQQRQEDDGMEQ